MYSLSLTACGNAKKVYAWGKTFTYQGAYSTNYEQHENDAPTYKNLLKKEFEANNLDFQNAKIYISPIESSKTIDLTVASTIVFNHFIIHQCNTVSDNFIFCFNCITLFFKKGLGGN